MAEIILITGGSRSGKSAFAQQLAEQQRGSRLFLATCPVMDAEMAERVRRHIGDRHNKGWDTVEEHIQVADSIEAASGYDVILVDCLTLWVNNLMYDAHLKGLEMTEDIIADKAGEILCAAREQKGQVIIVTNEVGMGIVPDNREARLFRDLVGRSNQKIAAAADRVFMVSCGIPLQIKGNAYAL